MQYKGSSYQSRHTGPKKKGRVVFVVLAVAIALVLGAAAVYFLFLTDNSQGGKQGPLGVFQQEAPTAFFAEGEVNAFGLTAPGDLSSLEQVEAYFRPILEYAADNGLNTLVLSAKQDLTVFWRDKNFPSYPSITQNDRWLDVERFDPLYRLCEICGEYGVQVWLSVDLYASGGYSSEMDFPAVKYAQEKNTIEEAAFSPEDEEYAAMLAESLALLPENYGIAGVVVENLPAGALWEEPLQSLLGQVRQSWAEGGHETGLVVALDATGADDMLPPYPAGSSEAEQLAALADSLLLKTGPDGDIGGRLQEWASVLPLVLAQPDNDPLAAVMFTSQNTENIAGVYWGEYAALEADPLAFGIARSARQPEAAALPTGFDIPQTLNVTYPEGDSLTWEGVYITGTSNPNEPLLMNGAEVSGRAANGAFGVYVPLEMGANNFVFENGAESFTKEIERTEPKASGGSSGGGSDDTQSVAPGTAVRMLRYYTNIISNPEDNYTISEIYPIGAVAVVTESVRVRGGTTWAYKLASGHYVLASNVEVIEGDGQSAFTGLSAENHEKGEYLNFEGTGSPGAYIAYLEDENNTLRLTMYDTSFTLPEGFTSKLVKRAWVEEGENGAVVLYLETEGLWGYNIEYTDGGTRLFLKQAPTLSDDPLAPLAGVHIMLDPGHGEATDGANYGAVGISGNSGYPHEKDINLALAQIIGYRLEQLGATVTYTREDDSNPGINERYVMQTTEKPDFFLSIHHDGLDGNRDLGENPTIFGIYYHPYNTPPSKGFAQNLMNSISAATNRTAEEAPRWGSINYGVIRTTVCPSVLFEYGLIVTPEHYDDATSTEGLYASALATVQAIMDTIPG